MQRNVQPVQLGEREEPIAQREKPGEQDDQRIQRTRLTGPEHGLPQPDIRIPQREVPGVKAPREELEPGNLQLREIVMIEPDESRRVKQERPVNHSEQQEQACRDRGPPS